MAIAESLWGRSDELRSLIASRAPIVVLAGDSGIGKSTLLKAAAEGSVDSAAVNRPISIRHTQSSVHALLSALAEVAANLASSESPSDVARTIAGAAAALASRYANELPRLMGEAILSFLKAQLGESVGSIVDDYLQELQKATPAGVASAIASEIEPLTAEVVGGFVQSVLSFTHGQPIRLFIDAGERFRQLDLGLLTDLADSLPQGCGIVVANRTSSAAEVDAVRWLANAAAATSVHDLQPLSEEVVQSWLQAEDLSADLAPAVMRRTGGYPQHISDIIPHLKIGASVDDAPFHYEFVQASNAVWQGLSPEVRRAAGRLAVFADPTDGLDSLVEGLDWFSLVEELERARVFSVRVNDVPWFHEERRAGILLALSSEERSLNHRSAALRVWELVQDQRRHDLIPELAYQVENAPTLISEDPSLAALVNSSNLELSVLAALIEMAERLNGFAVEANFVLRHWATRWRQIGDPIEGLRSLNANSLITMASNETAVVVVLFGEPLTLAVELGLIQRRLGRAPIAAIGSALFETVLREPLGHFGTAVHGTGDPSARSLSEELVNAASSSQELNGLIGLADYESVPFFFAANYSDEERLEEAYAALVGKSADVLGAKFTINMLQRYPIGRQPSERLVAAAELALAQQDHEQRPAARTGADPDRDVQPEEWMNARVRAVQLVRDHSTREERLAMDLARSWGLVWQVGADWSVELVLKGGPEAAIEADVTTSGARYDAFRMWTNPFEAFRLAASLDINRWADVRRLRSGGPLRTELHPLLTQLEDLRDEVRRFNSTQPRELIIVDPDKLEALIVDAVARRLELARTLAAEPWPSGGVPVEIPPTLTCVLIALAKPSTSWIPGAGGQVTIRTFAGDAAVDETRVQVLKDLPYREAGRMPVVETPQDLDFSTIFGVDASTSAGWSISDFTYELPQLLGYRFADVTFRWP